MENTYFAFGIHYQNDPILIKEKAADFKKNILNDDDFITIIEVKRGKHSIRKMATARDRRCRCSKYKTDTRAFWKQRRQQDLYTETILPWLDTKVAASLCKGVPINYQIRVDSGIPEYWILNFFVTAIDSKYCRSVYLVLVRALLWIIFDEVQHFSFLDNIFRRVNNADQDLGYRCRLPERENPMENVPLIVT